MARCTQTLDFTTDEPCPNEAEYIFKTELPGWHSEGSEVCENHAHIFEQMMHRHMPLIPFTLTRLTESKEK